MYDPAIASSAFEGSENEDDDVSDEEELLTVNW